MKKLVLSALILATVSPVWAEAGPRKPRNAAANRRPAASADQSQADAAVLNGAFRDLAKALASTLNEPGSRRLLKQEVGKKFDGDFNALYRDLANRPVGKGRAFRQALGGSFAKVQGRGRTVDSKAKAVAQRDLDELTASLPKLQIAVPAGFAEWDADTQAPLVTFVPEGIDDDELVEVEAFDAAGRSIMLDARVEPAFAVVVVGLNERTDDNGYLDNSASMKMVDDCIDQPYMTGGLEDSSGETTECESGGGGGGGYYDPYDPEFGDNPYEPYEPVTNPLPTLGVCDARTHNYGDKEILYQIKINNDHEPWVKGSPEIYAAYSSVDSQGIRGQYHMSNVDNEGSWYTVNGHLYYWQSHYGNTFAVAIWEKDGSNYGTFSYSYSGFSYSVPINDGDDQLGSNPVSFFDPICGYYSTGDAEYKMRYQAP
jgi:hypothetical protein